MRFWRKKRPDIADGSGYYCTQRGISTMRLALGYKTGLPKGFEVVMKPTGLDLYDVARLAWLSFPDREVLVFCNQLKYMDNVQPLDQFNQSFRPDWQDKYLWGFSYTVESTPEAHFVIGTPVTYNGEIQVVLAIGVEI